MKIAGITDLRYRKTFRFESLTRDDGSAATLRLVALPWGWDEQFTREVGGAPQAPIRKVGESNGEPIWKTCEDDADYQLKKLEFAAMQLAAMLYHALAEDQSVTWETPADMRGTDARGFWKSIANEIRQSGWPQAEVARLLAEVTKLNDSAATGVEEAKRSFFSTDG